LCLWVPGAGLEPAQPQWSQDFKSCVSTIPPSGHNNRRAVLQSCSHAVILTSNADEALVSSGKYIKISYPEYSNEKSHL
jgi:hypothetical protein